jgi:predicted metalloprotease with PDZ domain
LLAINDIRVAIDTLGDRLRQFAPGTNIKLTLFKQDLVYHTSLDLQPPVSDRYNLIPVAKPSARQSENLQAWLGVGL